MGRSGSSRGEPNLKFAPHQKEFVAVVERLKKNMIIGLTKDDDFKLEADWEFFTDMFKDKARNWSTSDKLFHLTALDVPEFINRKLSDQKWLFLRHDGMTEQRIQRIQEYNQRIEADLIAKFGPMESYNRESSAAGFGNGSNNIQGFGGFGGFHEVGAGGMQAQLASAMGYGMGGAMAGGMAAGMAGGM